MDFVTTCELQHYISGHRPSNEKVPIVLLSGSKWVAVERHHRAAAQTIIIVTTMVILPWICLLHFRTIRRRVKAP
jgi:hypothetical protein